MCECLCTVCLLVLKFLKKKIKKKGEEKVCLLGEKWKGNKRKKKKKKRKKMLTKKELDTKKK